MAQKQVSRKHQMAEAPEEFVKESCPGCAGLRGRVP